MKFFRYTGTIDYLKSLGYKFQKLYARNYITYSKGPIILYKSNQMIIEIDNLPAEHQSMVIQFILDNQSKSIDFWGYPSKIFKDYTVPAWSLINGKLYNKEMKIEEYRAGNEEIAFITGFLLTEEFRQAILDLKEIELIEKDCN